MEKPAQPESVGHNVFSPDVDYGDLERRSVELPDIAPGDVAFFDGRLIHRSRSNVGDGARWVVNFRLGNALDPKLINRGWRTMRDRTSDMFERVHPDLMRRTVRPQAAPRIAR